MSAPSASLHDFAAYRARRALRELGRNSRPRGFLWTCQGQAAVVVFQPARHAPPDTGRRSA